MSVSFSPPAEHLPALHAIQQIMYAARPPTADHLPDATYRSEWRCAAIRKFFEFAATTDEVVVVPDSFSCTIYISGTAYKLMSVRKRKAPEHVPFRARLRSNAHRWLMPAANQLPLFGNTPAEPGSDAMPVPLYFDAEGNLYVGWPDEVDTRGVGWGLLAAAAVMEMPLLTIVEPLAPAPEEVIPNLVVPPLKKVDDDGA